MEIYIPFGLKGDLTNTTHLCIAAHHDDIEIMAYDGILKCFGSEERNFCGTVVTNGAGSPRAGVYAHMSDEKMRETRKLEQKKAAFIGEYAAQIFLDFDSEQVKSSATDEVVTAIERVIDMTRPEVIYTHNLADKHPSHVAVAMRTIAALRNMNYAPKLFGCEVWRSLDWLSDDDKVTFNHSERQNLENALISVFDSQISGGKRYDLATAGRRIANATYAKSHSVDQSTSATYAMDLTPLVQNKNLCITEFVQNFLNNFCNDVLGRVQ